MARQEAAAIIVTKNQQDTNLQGAPKGGDCMAYGEVKKCRQAVPVIDGQMTIRRTGTEDPVSLGACGKPLKFSHILTRLDWLEPHEYCCLPYEYCRRVYVSLFQLNGLKTAPFPNPYPHSISTNRILSQSRSNGLVMCSESF